MANFDYSEFNKYLNDYNEEKYKRFLDMYPGYGNIERDRYGAILDGNVGNMFDYLHYTNNVELIRLLVERAKQLPDPSREKLWGLEEALLYGKDFNNRFADCELQLDILRLQNERVAMCLLCHFDYEEYPDEQVIEKLVQLKMVKPLRYLLSHSIVGAKISEVCQAFPQLKLEVYLAELARLCHILDISDRMLSKDCKSDMIELDDETEHHAQRVAQFIKQIEALWNTPWFASMDVILAKLYLDGDNVQVRQECLSHIKNFCDDWKTEPEISFFKDILSNL